MKTAVEMYHKTGMIMQPDGVNISDRVLIENYFYHLLFYIDEFNRAIDCIYNQNYYQPDLYGGESKVLLIQYYRHHSWNLLNYLGMIKDGVDKINKIEICKDILDFDYDKSTRNFVTHIYEKMGKLNETTGILHGFNVIFSKEDEFLRDIKEPVFNLDLLSKEINMIIIDRDMATPIQYDYKIELSQLKPKINSLKSQIEIIQRYTKFAWYQT